MELIIYKMKREIDLLKFYPKSKRPIEDRGNLVTDIDRAVARKFDVEYYDGDRLTGYGGYGYSPRFWTDTVAHIVDVYSLSNDSKILDIGCAKGYMMYDLSLLIPEAEIKGVDISQYAKDHAIEPMKENIVVYGISTSRSLRVHWVLNELSLPYSSVAFRPRSEYAKSDEYKKINPSGKIPSIRIGESVLTESAA
ncbi:MAG: hypothetical protein CMC34_03200, partial [Flavobacteriaceae bacterium]|nr:hypothetical protein [Flavobacteriaceae bacterium]